MYVGEDYVQYVEVPDAPNDGWIESTSWDRPPYIALKEQSDAGAIVYISHYFDGTESLTANCYYGYFFNGRQNLGQYSQHYFFTCKPVYATLSKTTLSLDVGQREKLTYKLSEAKYNSKKWSEDKCEWKSSNEQIAEVDAYGNVYGKADGKCVITLDPVVGPEVMCTVTVGDGVYREKLKLSCSHSSGKVKAGTKVTLSTTNASNADIYYTLDGSDPTKNDTKYTSSGIIVNYDCNLKAIAYKDGYTESDILSRKYTIIIEPTSISLPSTETVLLGSKKQLEYTLYPNDASSKITWKSGDLSIATVSSNGIVTGVKDGTTVITATTENGKTASCELTVTSVIKSKSPEGVEVSYIVKDGSSPYLLVSSGDENTPAIDKNYNGHVSIPYFIDDLRVKGVGYKAFYGCSISSISFEDSYFLFDIFNSAFENCNNLKYVYLPSGSRLYSQAFKNCESLETIFCTEAIYFGSSATNFMKTHEVFANCNNLKDIYYYYNTNNGLSDINDDMFSSLTYQNAVLHVEKGKSSSFKWTSGWKKFKSIEEIDKILVGASPAGGAVSKGTMVRLYATKSYQRKIYYTLDGSTPTKNSSEYSADPIINNSEYYSAGIIINSNCTLKAIAYIDSNEKSDVLELDFTLGSPGVKPTGITVSPSSKTIKVGETFTPTYSLTPSGATSSVTWYSDDSSIASVNSSTGVVTGKKAGTTSIHAKTSNGLSDYCKVTVEEVKTTSISLPATQSMKEGQETTLTATVTPSNAKPTLKWWSEDEAIAKVVSYSGMSATISGEGGGTTKIWVETDNGKKDYCNVTVTGLPKGPVKMVSGSTHTLVLLYDGTVLGCGNNGSGQLGDGTKVNKSDFVKVTDNAVFIEADYEQSFIIKKDGSLWGCGVEYYIPSDDKRSRKYGPNRETLYKIMDDVASVSASWYHTLIVKKDGTLWAYGVNSSGQFGNGTTKSATAPVKITDNVESAVAGNFHSLVLKKDGSLWACGRNEDGELGDGTNIERHSLVEVKGVDNIVALAGKCFRTSYVITQDGTLWGWGQNLSGQLNDGTKTNRNKPQKVMDNVSSASSVAYVLAVKKDGSLWGVGNNKSGQLGNGTTTNADRPIKIMDDVKSAAAAGGSIHSLIVKNDGSLWVCGNNQYGQLGDGTTTDRLELVKVMSGGEIPLDEDDIFTAKTSEGIEMTFQVIDAISKTCRVGQYSQGTDEDGIFHYKNAIDSSCEGNVTIPSLANGYEVTTIGTYAFYHCNARSFEIPSSVTKIEKNAFEDCNSLQRIKLPNSIKAIDSWAFSSSENLEIVISEIERPFDLLTEWRNPFGGISANAILYVPNGTKEEYEAKAGWKEAFSKIVEGDPTAIERIHAEREVNDKVYTLSGQRLKAPRRGINIIGGKKVLVK